VAAGQRLEGSVGLYDYNARYYSPLFGRFISADSIVPEPGNPQALNRYSYVLNNPLQYTDPNGHFWWIAGGAAVGAGIAYAAQVIANLDSGLSVDQALIQVNWTTVAVGAATGAIGAATFGASLAVIGAATGINVTAASVAAVGASTAAGVVSGRAAQATANILTGQPLGADLFDPGAIALDAVTAGAGPALRAVRGQVSPFVKGRLTRHMHRAIDDLVQDAAFLSDDLTGQGRRIHRRTAELMRAEGIPGLEIERTLARNGEQGRLDYWFRPENRVYDIKPAGASFIEQAAKYRRLTGGSKVEAIRYQRWW
jgi:RHS repeat-associated protein